MPTDSHPAILDRDLSVAGARPAIELVTNTLGEVINYSTWALVRCQASGTGEADEGLAPLTLYRHLIEMTDGIEVLLGRCCPGPAIPLLRSSYEARLALTLNPPFASVRSPG